MAKKQPSAAKDGADAKTAEDPRSRWREGSERLRSNARIFVTSLAAVAVTVVAGLSLTGLGTLEPGSAAFASAVTGALLATLGIVVMLALVMRLASSSSVSLSELRSVEQNRSRAMNWRRLFHPGHAYAARIVAAKDNGLLSGFDDLDALSAAADQALADEQRAFEESAAAPADGAKAVAFAVAAKRAGWYQNRLDALTAAASYERLRWNFGVTAVWMTAAGAVAAVGIVTYAASLQPRQVSPDPVAVDPHDQIVLAAPADPAAAALFAQVVGCAASTVDALVLEASGATIEAITIPSGDCRSVTITADWDGTGYVASFDLPAATPAATP